MGDDFIFEVLGVLEYETVMFMHNGCGELRMPYVEEAVVDDVGFGVLWVIGDGTADGVFFGATIEEPTFTAGYADDVANGYKLAGYPLMPFVVAGKGQAIEGLEISNEVNGNSGLLADGRRHALKVSAMTDLLA